MGNEADDCSCLITGIKYLVLIICSAVGAGPLLSLTIQQVCISKCLLLRRLPLVGGANADDVLLILLYCFYMMFNYTIISLAWSLACKCIKSVTLKCDKACKSRYSDICTPMGPKKMKSGCVYGYNKAKSVHSDHESDKTKASTTQSTCS